MNSYDYCSYLSNCQEELVDVDAWLGSQGYKVRFVAVRLGKDEVRKKIAKKKRENQKRGKGKTLTKRQLALCSWAFYVTNIPKSMCTAEEITILYRGTRSRLL